ncbi:MAG: ferrous iron transport protein B [Fimbriimonadaceae bacterium]|nr:ferrous iron transport protein B [Fimbriimonadaceae bacterium]
MSTTLGKKTARVAIVGRPNAGKTTLFNALTGAKQRIGNYPGITVEIAEGSYCVSGRVIQCLDVPGLYSLRAISEDEDEALRVMTAADDSAADLYVIVMDGSSLERCLFLFSQVAELGRPMLVALTMTDVEAVDAEELSRHIGVEVIPVVAHRNQGVDELRDAIERNLADPVAPDLELGYPEMVRIAVQRLAQNGVAGSVNELREYALGIRSHDGLPELQRLQVEAEMKDLLGKNIEGRLLDSQTRYAWASSVRKAVHTTAPRTKNRTDKIDAVLTHRVFGVFIFLAIMYGVFQGIYTLASPLMDLIEMGTGWLSDLVSGPLSGTPMLHDLVIDGVIAGVGGVLVFLPQIAILFFFIAVLEGSGYLARAAFLMDRSLGWCGLNGRAFIPLLSSYACAIPGIMAARVMPDPKSRLATILVAPLMSCSARLPVYVLLIGIFIEPQYGAAAAGLALFGMHIVGLLVAVPTALVLNRGFLKGPRLPFLLEMPRYQWPKPRDVAITVWSKVASFLKTAGTVILAMSIVIWALLYFPRTAPVDRYRNPWTPEQIESQQAQRQLENSYLGQFGRAVTPVFEPAGFDWRLTTSIIAAFPAREVVVPAMSVIFGMGEGEDSDDLRSAIRDAKKPDGTPLMGLSNAISLMVFFALCCQCLSTVATIKAETKSWKWAWLAFFYMTAIAWVLAVVVYQAGIAFGWG